MLKNMSCKKEEYVVNFYDSRMVKTLTTHDVTWWRHDSIYIGYYAIEQAEEEPLAPIIFRNKQISPHYHNQEFSRYNFVLGLE